MNSKAHDLEASFSGALHSDYARGRRQSLFKLLLEIDMRLRKEARKDQADHLQRVRRTVEGPEGLKYRQNR